MTHLSEPAAPLSDTVPTKSERGIRFVAICGSERKRSPCSRDHRKGKVTDTEPPSIVDCDRSVRLRPLTEFHFSEGPRVVTAIRPAVHCLSLHATWKK